MKELDSEKEIIALLKEGDERAMKPIFNSLNKGLCSYANKIVHNKEEAEDIVAKAFIKLWEKRTGFEAFSSIRSFMYVVIKNDSINYLRHIKCRNSSHEEILHLYKKDENYIENNIIKAELLRIIFKEAESLPPDRRRIFKMIFLYDLDIFEIARKLNITADTVRVQKARSIKRLREILLRKGIISKASQITGVLYFLKLLQIL